MERGSTKVSRALFTAAVLSVLRDYRKTAERNDSPQVKVFHLNASKGAGTGFYH